VRKEVEEKEKVEMDNEEEMVVEEDHVANVVEELVEVDKQ